MKSFAFAALLLSSILCLNSACKKEALADVKEDLIALKSQAQTEQSLALILEIVQEEISKYPDLNTGVSGATFGQCPAVSLSTGGFPATLTIDFGNGCVTKKGHQMEGKIEAIVSGKTDVSGASVDVKLVGVKVNQSSVSGNVNMVTQGNNGTAQQNIDFSVQNLVVTTKDGKTVTLTQMTGARNQLEGQETTPKTNGPTALQDDVFSINFSGNGTDADGKAFTLQTTTALRREYDCRYIVSGVIEYKVQPAAKTADYGNGNCDNLLEVSIGGVKKNVELP